MDCRFRGSDSIFDFLIVRQFCLYIYMERLYLSHTNIGIFYVYDKYHEVVMEISFQLLQQQNPWWFREEVI